MLALTTLAMALLLVVTRDLLTAGVLMLLGAIAFAALKWAPGWLQNLVAYAEAWLLLTSEIGGLAALVVNRARGISSRDDAAGLADTTPVPAAAWILAWAALIGWAVWTAAPLLWP
ncbi:MAG TPA: M50 family metallopeptidase [Streptomyces sp.]